MEKREGESVWKEKRGERERSSKDEKANEPNHVRVLHARMCTEKGETYVLV